jgi:hypothetical protein
MSNKSSKSFPIGRDSTTGRLMPVEKARQNPSKTTVERMPKAGNGSAGKSKK